MSFGSHFMAGLGPPYLGDTNKLSDDHSSFAIENLASS